MQSHQSMITPGEGRRKMANNGEATNAQVARFMWECPECGQRIYREKTIHNGDFETALNANMEIECPGCGKRHTYVCNRAIEIFLSKA